MEDYSMIHHILVTPDLDKLIVDALFIMVMWNIVVNGILTISRWWLILQ
jgi:hypothetical protein